MLSQLRSGLRILNYDLKLSVIDSRAEQGFKVFGIRKIPTFVGMDDIINSGPG